MRSGYAVGAFGTRLTPHSCRPLVSRLFSNSLPQHPLDAMEGLGDLLHLRAAVMCSFAFVQWAIWFTFTPMRSIGAGDVFLDEIGHGRNGMRHTVGLGM